jgi:hypothetical protein
MKKLYTTLVLLVIIGLSSAFAQNEHTIMSIQKNRKTLLRTNNKQQSLTPFNKQSSFSSSGKNPTELYTNSLIVLYDSVYSWSWDTLANA